MPVPLKIVDDSSNIVDADKSALNKCNNVPDATIIGIAKIVLATERPGNS